MCEALVPRGWTVVDDKAGEEYSWCDGLPPRERMEKVATEALKNGQHTVIDRTNIEASQRANWLKVSREAGVPDALVAIVAMNTPQETCKERIMQRMNHRLQATEPSLKVVDRFVEGLTPPTRAEGFGAIYGIATEAKIAQFVESMSL